ncbi:MAG: hypothetical protein Satyrvirus8_26 [Satyrvirus sp.]|uniref:Uncharacterized protein n=1 Tax=Satyrvirus sp. TaxID=2487771 RepID=A0A3G5ADS2_9VIRU|nr:MAG: hypothetical protein Satyrvirus8_26 [Satyrvirus sp.]
MGYDDVSMYVGIRIRDEKHLFKLIKKHKLEYIEKGKKISIEEIKKRYQKSPYLCLGCLAICKEFNICGKMYEIEFEFHMISQDFKPDNVFESSNGKKMMAGILFGVDITEICDPKILVNGCGNGENPRAWDPELMVEIRNTVRAEFLPEAEIMTLMQYG